MHVDRAAGRVQAAPQPVAAVTASGAKFYATARTAPAHATITAPSGIGGQSNAGQRGCAATDVQSAPEGGAAGVTGSTEESGREAGAAESLIVLDGAAL